MLLIATYFTCAAESECAAERERATIFKSIFEPLFLTLINDFLRRRHKKAWDGKNFHIILIAIK